MSIMDIVNKYISEDAATTTGDVAQTPEKNVVGGSSGHYKMVCSKCNDVYGQCRCRSCDKEVRYGVCSKCRGN